MGSASEIVVGFVHPKAEDFMKKQGFKDFNFKEHYELEDEDPNYEKWITKINDALAIAQKNTLINHYKFKYIGVSKTGPEYNFYETPAGKREIASIGFQIYADDEIDSIPKSCAVGYSVSARYFPVLVDWKSPSGTLYDPIPLDEMTNAINFMKQEVEKVLPGVFTDAKSFVKEVGY